MLCEHVHYIVSTTPFVSLFPYTMVIKHYSLEQSKQLSLDEPTHRERYMVMYCALVFNMYVYPDLDI